MKKLLRQVFFWDSSAHGAFFGLTLAGIGTWLLLSIFHFLWTVGAIGWIGTPIYWESPETVTLLVVLVEYNSANRKAVSVFKMTCA